MKNVNRRGMKNEENQRMKENSREIRDIFLEKSLTISFTSFILLYKYVTKWKLNSKGFKIKIKRDFFLSIYRFFSNQTRKQKN